MRSFQKKKKVEAPWVNARGIFSSCFAKYRLVPGFGRAKSCRSPEQTRPERSRRSRRAKADKLFLLGLLGFLGVLGGAWLTKNQFSNSRVTSSLVSPVVQEESLKILFKNLGEEITGIILDKGDYLVATISSGTTIYFNQGEDFVKTLASLQLIFKNIRIEGRWPVKIDLRFSRPILGY